MKNKTLSRRHFLKAGTVAAAGAVLAACAPKVVKETVVVEKPVEKIVKETVIVEGTPQVVEKVVKETVVVSAPVEKIKLVYQSEASGTEELWETFFDYMYQKYPTIEEIEWLPNPGWNEQLKVWTAQMAAGDAADVYQSHAEHLIYFLDAEQVTSLQEFLDLEATEVDIDDLSASQLGVWTRDGKIYFMPYYLGTFCIFYNKDMFDELGIPYPASKWGEHKFEDYHAAALGCVSRDEPKVWGTMNYGPNARWTSQVWLWGFGGTMVDENDRNKAALCTDEAQECLETLRTMIHDEHSFAFGADTGGVGISQLFYGGRVGMIEMGSWGIPDAAEGADFNWDVAPHFTHRRTTSYQTTDGQFVWAGSDHKEEAWALVKEISGPVFQRLNITVGAGNQSCRQSLSGLWLKTIRQRFPAVENANIELFTQAVEQNIGSTDVFFPNNDTCKATILQPAFDQVLKEGVAPTELICEYSKYVEKYNTGEISLENLGAALESIKL